MHPPDVPDHTLLRPIGRGAYGEVWLARNVMGALRAVKVIWRQQFDSDRPFQREFDGIQRFEPVSRSADGLVHVLHVGRNDAEGYFYYVMELADAAEQQVESQSELRVESHPQPSAAVSQPSTQASLNSYTPRTLRSDLKRFGKLPTADCLRLALDVVSGLERLHRQGLVHRDVKPGNIIFVEGRAKLADLGLVSADGEGHTFVGTEGYIAPEGPGAPAADLYALGIALYEASTGFPPERFPDMPSEWVAKPGSDDAIELHEIILKACEGQRERRYQSANAMQADLALLHSGQSVRRAHLLERRVKLARRGGLVAAVIALIATTGVLLAGWRAQVAEQARAKESSLRTRAETAERDARERLHSAYLAEVRAAVQSPEAGRRFGTLETMRRAGLIRVTPEVRRAAFVAMALPDLQVERDMDLGSDTSNLAFDSDFSRYAVGRGRGAVEIYSLAGTSLLQRLPAATNLDARQLQFSTDGRYLAFKRDHDSGIQSDLEVWDLVATQRVLFIERGVTRNAFCFQPRLPRLLAGQPGGKLVEWDLERKAAVNEWSTPPLQCADYAPDGGRFAVAHSSGSNSKVEVRASENGAILAAASFRELVQALDWDPEGRYVAVACRDGSVYLMTATDGLLNQVGRHKTEAVGVIFDPKGEFLFSRGWDREVNVWNLRTRQREVTYPMLAASLSLDRGGRRVGMLGDKSHLLLLNFSRGEECRELEKAEAASVRQVRFSTDQRWLAIMGSGRLAVWDLQRPGRAAEAQGSKFELLGFATGTPELFAWNDRKPFRWQLTPGADGGLPRMESLPVLYRGQPLSLGMLTNPPAIWVPGQAGLQTAIIPGRSTGWSNTLSGTDWHGSVSPDGRWLARRFTGSWVLTLASLTQSGLLIQLTNNARVHAQGFSPDSASLAVLTDCQLKIFDTRTWGASLSRAAEGSTISHLAYSPDGRLLLCVENVRTAALLDARTLEPVLAMPEWAHPLEMSPDGRWLVVSVEGRRLQLWDFAAVRARFRELGIDWRD